MMYITYFNSHSFVQSSEFINHLLMRVVVDLHLLVQELLRNSRADGELVQAA